MGIFGDADSWFGSSGAVGSILGGLGTAATIYGLHSQNKAQENASRMETEEARRQFDLKYQLEKEKLAMAGGGGGGGGSAAAMAGVKAAIQANHSRAMQGAYDSMIQAVEEGRSGEAAALTGIIDRIQKAYASR